MQTTLDGYTDAQALSGAWRKPTIAAFDSARTLLRAGWGTPGYRGGAAACVDLPIYNLGLVTSTATELLCSTLTFLRS